MATYDELWHDRVAPRMRARLLMTELLYLAPNDRYDRLLRDLDRTDEDTLERINQGDALAIRNLVHLADLPLLARFARQQLAR